MFVIYQRLEKRLKEINKQIKSIKRQIKQMPSGKLICCGDSWYQSDGHNKIYIKKKDKSLAEKLATKKYLLAKLKDLENEKVATDMYLRHYSNGRKHTDCLFDSSTEFLKLLPASFTPISAELKTWMDAPYEKNTEHPEHLIHRVGPDEYVRSKSEAMIAKALKEHKIPYRYECKLILGDVELYPDFTIRHPRTGKLYYFEHFGLLDKPNYVKNMHSKLQLFTSYHIMPGINLIATFENNENPLTFEQVEAIIEFYFL